MERPIRFAFGAFSFKSEKISYLWTTSCFCNESGFIAGVFYSNDLTQVQNNACLWIIKHCDNLKSEALLDSYEIKEHLC